MQKKEEKKQKNKKTKKQRRSENWIVKIQKFIEEFITIRWALIDTAWTFATRNYNLSQTNNWYAPWNSLKLVDLDKHCRADSHFLIRE